MALVKSLQYWFILSTKFLFNHCWPAESTEDPLLLPNGVQDGEYVRVVHVVVHPIDEEGRIRALHVQARVEELAVLLHLLLQLLAHWCSTGRKKRATVKQCCGAGSGIRDRSQSRNDELWLPLRLLTIISKNAEILQQKIMVAEACKNRYPNSYNFHYRICQLI